MSHFEDRLGILRRGDVGDGAKLLAIYVLDLQGLSAGCCTMTNSRLARDLDCTPRAIQRRIVDLAWVGLLELDEGPPRKMIVVPKRDAWTLPQRGTTPASPPVTLASPPYDTSVTPPTTPASPPLEEQEEEQEDPTPEWGMSREKDEDYVLKTLRLAFYKEWKAHFKTGANHEPRPVGPEEGHAREVVRWLLRTTGGDVHRACRGARMLSASMFRSEFLTSRGKPWRWASVAKDPGHFFPSPANPSWMKTEEDRAKDFDRRMARAERDAAPAHVGRELLAALKGLVPPENDME